VALKTSTHQHNNTKILETLAAATFNLGVLIGFKCYDLYIFFGSCRSRSLDVMCCHFRLPLQSPSRSLMPTRSLITLQMLGASGRPESNLSLLFCFLFLPIAFRKPRPSGNCTLQIDRAPPELRQIFFTCVSSSSGSSSFQLPTQSSSRSPVRRRCQ
jgi:hypothetical protein